MSKPRLIIASGKEKALLRRHPWIFSGAVKRVEGNPQEGDMVDVCSADGTWMAAGHFQNESIICKVLTFDRKEADLPVEELLRRRVHSAVDYRIRLGFFDYLDVVGKLSEYAHDEHTDVFRMVHAEGDFLPGLVCDWYNGVLVMQAHSIGMHRLFPQLVEIFKGELRPLGLVSVFDKSSATLPKASDPSDCYVERPSGRSISDHYLWGITPDEWEITENGVKMLINFYEGQKTGFFIDQRDNRALVQRLAGGHRVLNCFGYTGGFSLAALRGGAEFVETVDISKKAIALCNRNVELNFGPDAPHRGTVADVLGFFARPEGRAAQQSTADGRPASAPSNADGRPASAPSGAEYDFIILDPPAFAKNHRSLQAGLRGYRTINQRAMEALPDGGLLMTFSCSQAVSVEDFRTMVFTAAANAKRQVRIVRTLPHAADHPVSVYHPEGEYLKGLLLEVRS